MGFFQKKNLKKLQNFKVAFLDLFGLQWLSSFQALIVAIFQGIQNIENGNPEGKSQLI